MRAPRETNQIEIPIITQDPHRSPNPVEVKVRGPLPAGPIGERMAVFDRFTGENEVPKDSVLNGWRARLKNTNRLLRTDSRPLGESVAVTLDG
jgi:hypothetical protein